MRSITSISERAAKYELEEEEDPRKLNFTRNKTYHAPLPCDLPKFEVDHPKSSGLEFSFSNQMIDSQQLETKT